MVSGLVLYEYDKVESVKWYRGVVVKEKLFLFGGVSVFGESVMRN